MEQVELRHGARTDVGLVREVNEDDLLAAPPVFVVADGMGGHDGGDVASRIVVEEFGRLAAEGYDPRRGREAVEEVLVRCQQRIDEYAAGRRAEGRKSSPGTTAVSALLVETDDGPAWLVSNLGDSRCYRLVDERLVQVSVDHSLVQELVDSGQLTREEAAHHPERNVITRALGGSGTPQPDHFLLTLAEAPRLLLCSDGINGMLDDATIASVLGGTGDAEEAAGRLVEAALSAGGRDNATALVVDVTGPREEPADG
ncbi:MAG TPA: protein phosphatase 2C domain-containing protein [Nocardioides sp.]|nr:protein phosphatase 2C domain-containing protein [Nocardioides sp.]